METDAQTEQKTARNGAENGAKTAQKTIENGAENGAKNAQKTDENRVGNGTGNERVYGAECGGCPYCGEPRRALLSADSAPLDLRWAGVRVYAALCDRRGPALDLLVVPVRPGGGHVVADSVPVSFCPVCGRAL